MKSKHGLADSPFFKSPITVETGQPIPVFPQGTTPVFPLSKSLPEVSEDARQNGVMVSRYHATDIEGVRRAVKEFGKEAATHRFTLAEKRAIANIMHTLQMQGIRTTENEITRIAVNYVIDEFNLQGKDSLLALVLQALNK